MAVRVPRRLTVEHVVLEGTDRTDDEGFITLDYVAKSGQHRQIVLEDDDLADVLATLASDADDELFWFDDSGGGARRRADARDINRFIVEWAGPAFSAKDFRTWGASSIALQARALGGDLLEAVDEAAQELGNTRAVARSSYIHPIVLGSDASTIADLWHRSRTSQWHDRSESALAKLLSL